MGIAGIPLTQAFIIFAIFLIFAFFLWLLTRILRKAGYSAWWVITTFIPIVNLVMLYIFAFSTWPNKRNENIS